MWIRGWSVLGRSLLAYLIVGVFSAPLSWYVTFLLRSSEPRWAVALFVLLAGFVLYLPLVFYVAGSWVGFCPYVTAEEDRMPGPDTRSV